MVAPSGLVPRPVLSYSAKPFREAHSDEQLFGSRCELQPDWEHMYPFAQMIIGGCWSSTLVLARFPLLRSLFPLQDDFPPQAWLEHAQHVHRMPSAAPLLASRFLDVASELKKRAIEAPGDNNKFAGMVEYLQDVAATLQCTAVEVPKHKRCAISGKPCCHSISRICKP